MTRAARFWAKVDQRGPDECWPWLGAVQSNGYGRFGWASHVVVYAHRVVFMLAGIELGKGVDVDHECHNADASCPGGACPHRRCCNPRHLRLTSRSTNTRDGFHGLCRARRHLMAATAVKNGAGRTCGACRAE